MGIVKAALAGLMKGIMWGLSLGMLPFFLSATFGNYLNRKCETRQGFVAKWNCARGNEK